MHYKVYGHRSAEGYLSCVMRIQRTSVDRVAAQVAVGYFENTVAGKITERKIVMHFFISTHLQVNPSILNLRLIMINHSP